MAAAAGYRDWCSPGVDIRSHCIMPQSGGGQCCERYEPWNDCPSTGPSAPRPPSGPSCYEVYNNPSHYNSSHHYYPPYHHHHRHAPGHWMGMHPVPHSYGSPSYSGYRYPPPGAGQCCGMCMNGLGYANRCYRGTCCPGDEPCCCAKGCCHNCCISRPSIVTNTYPYPY
ncbi:hypothetical protein Ciccas_008022 [Cichlidogyrus casuarinus]|uniref:Uncharacterized protein n=1 Tax=Cichlidogyrus casuarinus TaxID=1844966 RepID=A0ABD2Q177_9PLAT